MYKYINTFHDKEVIQMKKQDTTVKMPYRDSLASFIDSLLDMAKGEELTNIMVAGRTSDGEVVTGSSNVNHAEMMTLIGYLQVHAMEKRYEGEAD